MCVLYRDEPKGKSMEVTGTIKLARTCCKNGDEKLTRKVHEVKEDGKRKRERPRKTWEEEVREKNIYGKRRKMGGRKENVQRQRENNVANYGGETHETQLLTTLHHKYEF